nr:protein ILITYHIA isoform X1 [Tanacetum cinerariifolium]
MRSLDPPSHQPQAQENGNSNSNGRQDTVSKERVGAGKKDTGKLTKKHGEIFEPSCLSMLCASLDRLDLCYQ